jgi:hypothetical protein
MKRSDMRMFIHCTKCIEEKPSHASPSEWVRLEMGITESGILVWCLRHNQEVAHISVDMLTSLVTNPPPCGMAHTDGVACGHGHEEEEQGPAPTEEL